MINSWTVTTFPFTVNQGNIENCGQGYFTIKWKWTYYDEDEAEITETDETSIEGVMFTQN